MLERWFRSLKLDISFGEFQRLPSHPAYRYEYLRDRALITGRAKIYHCLRSIDEGPAHDVIGVDRDHRITLRPLAEQDWDELATPFAHAFARTPPYHALNSDDQRACAAECLNMTRTGGDGPLVTRASFVAVDDEQKLCGGILVTLMHAGDMESFADEGWKQPAPENALEQRWGRPHLTWVFVERHLSRWGVGEALLRQSLNVLRGMGYREIASTFMLGNESSMLWHWKMGFRLLGYVMSPRRIRGG